MRSLSIPASFALIALLAAACGHGGGKPSEAALLGVWRLKPESLASAAQRAGAAPKDARLQLDADGRCAVADMPVDDPFSKPEFRLVGGSCRWRLERKQTWMLTIITDDGRGHSYYLEPDGGAGFDLVYHVGEPDSQEVWAWRKAP